MAKSNRRPLAVLHIALIRAIGAFIIKMRAIQLNMLNHSSIFVSPTVPLTTFLSDIVVLEAAESVARTRVTGAAADRDIKYEKVLDDAHSLQGYVQSLADAAIDEVTAISIIEASGFDVKNHGVRVKPLLSAKNDPAMAGRVLLIAKAAARRAAYEWQYSTDGSNWTDLPTTLQAKTKVEGLTTGGYFFRFRPITKDGEGSWTPMVGLNVIA